jgi:hypothetical protein
VPSEDFKVPTDLIRDGAVCINFSSYRNFDGPAIKEKASIYVPSTGKVTIAVLLRNLVVCVHARPFCHVENVLTGLPAPRRQPPAARGVIGGGPESEERGFQGWLIWLHFWDFPYTFRFKCRRPRKKGE